MARQDGAGDCDAVSGASIVSGRQAGPMARVARQQGSRRWAELQLDLAASAARTATGTGAPQDFQASLAGAVMLEVTTASGPDPRTTRR